LSHSRCILALCVSPFKVCDEPSYILIRTSALLLGDSGENLSAKTFAYFTLLRKDLPPCKASDLDFPFLFRRYQTLPVVSFAFG